jgi:hypothetical protein
MATATASQTAELGEEWLEAARRAGTTGLLRGREGLSQVRCLAARSLVRAEIGL